MKKMLLLILAVPILCCNYSAQSGARTLREDVSFLASDSLAGRKTGTKEELIAADFIRSRMRSLGLEPRGDGGGYYQTFIFRPGMDARYMRPDPTKSDTTIAGTNVIGYIDNHADNTIIVGAHFDHLGRGGDGSLYTGEAAIHNGADDNASGVAMLLYLAERLRSTSKGNNYLFVAFSGEEMGLLGSNYFVKNATVDLSRVNYMVNLDMVGRLRADNTLSVSGSGTSPVWDRTLHEKNPGFRLVLNPSGLGPSDHTSFYMQGIPALHFFTGQHEDYHKPSDDADKLNYKGMERIASYILTVIDLLDDSQKLVFTKTSDQRQEVPRFKVTLGVMPDYLFDGRGMRIDAVSDGKAAMKAGLKKGDVVIRLGDSTVTDMMSYMRALSGFETGDSTRVVVDRQGVEVEAGIVF